MEQNIERYNPSVKEGLNTEQINKRIEAKLVNYDSSVPTKSFKQIFFDNFFTLFNLLNLVLGIAIFAVGSYKNMTLLALNQIPKLRGLEAHSSVLLSRVDEQTFKRLGLRLTCEPKYEEKNKKYQLMI